ncbi:MAG: prephenate dehydratase [Chloroflexi bacterium]|nr:prephenate dehydratase [Chloroflexota bacterium]
MSVDDLRKRIDELDLKIVGLIGERCRIARDIGRDKKERRRLIEDKGRESQVLGNVKKAARDFDIKPADIENIYTEIIGACRRLQGAEVSYQGEAGSYAEEAALAFFGGTMELRPKERLEDVFRAVEEAAVQFGVVPIENSLEGSISRVYDLLLDSTLMVCGELELRVSHCLIGADDAGLDTISKVYSHPQALAQSRNFLKHLKAELIPTYNTAASVKMVKESGEPGSAAIASARAAAIYDMKIIAREIEDNPNNFTRFFILSGEDSPPSGSDKTSIVFSTKDRPGALYHSLGEFASRDVNLTKLESRPTRHKPWEYNFYLDFAGHRQDQPAAEALASLEKTCIFVKILGSYPKAR